METCWERLTPPEFEKLASEHKLCILPIGSLERHGEHMPFGTDSFICHSTAVGASSQEPCVVFPPYWFGQVHEAACFSGAVNLPTQLCLEMLETILDQIAYNGFEKIVILNGHGGNSHMLKYFAMSQMDREVPYTLYIIDRIADKCGEHTAAIADIFETGGGHACEWETSVIMAIAPETLRMEYQRFSEPIEPRDDLVHLKGAHTALWWYALYPENVAGCPSKASREKGQQALDAAILDVAAQIKMIKADTVVPLLQKEYYKRCAEVGRFAKIR